MSKNKVLYSSYAICDLLRESTSIMYSNFSVDARTVSVLKWLWICCTWRVTVPLSWRRIRGNQTCSSTHSPTKEIILGGNDNTSRSRVESDLLSHPSWVVNLLLHMCDNSWYFSVNCKVYVVNARVHPPKCVVLANDKFDRKLLHSTALFSAVGLQEDWPFYLHEYLLYLLAMAMTVKTERKLKDLGSRLT